MPMKASHFQTSGSVGSGIRYGRIRVFKKSSRNLNQRLCTTKGRLEIERRLQTSPGSLGGGGPPGFGGEDSVTILRVVRSSLERLYCCENLQSFQILETVAGFA